MKKKLIYAGILAIAIAFTSCKDDDVANWEKIPTTEIKGENITITGVGNSVGSLQLATSNGTQGVLSMKNIVYGCENVAIDVTMTDKGNGSFDFSGSKTIDGTTKSADLSTIRTVKVNGNITVDGKATVHISTEATGGLVKPWNLTDTITFDTNIVVSSAPFLLNWLPIKIEDERTGTDGVQTSNAGSSVASHIMTEVLKQVTFNTDGNITALYYNELPFNSDEAMDWIMGKIMSGGDETLPSHTNWLESPENLAYWYTKNDNELYVIPDIESILKQVSTGTDQADYSQIINLLKSMASADEVTLQKYMNLIRNMDAIKNLGIDLSIIETSQVKEILSWLTTGVPLKYRNTEYGIYIYVDKEQVAPFMPLFISLLPTLQTKLDELAETVPLAGLLTLFLGVNELADYEYIWEKNTDIFELGLNFKY